MPPTEIVLTLPSAFGVMDGHGTKPFHGLKTCESEVQAQSSAIIKKVIASGVNCHTCCYNTVCSVEKPR